MPTDQAPPKYSAFLSYSHADARKAKRWQRRLESFRFDEPLIRLGAPATLVPVFRDRDDFPAGGELTELTRQALAQSAALVLLASPNAARSKAVNEEVRLFRHAHPDRKLVVILDAPRGAKFQDCLPEALRYELDETGAVTTRAFTPLAADPGADGAPAASAKVIAGLTGLEVTDLLGRVEAALRREAWRFRAALAAIALLLLMLGGVGWGLWDMRAAQRQEAALAAQRDAAATEARQRLERMVQDAAGGGGPAVKAVAAFRDLMRPFNADIDTIPPERLPGLMQQVLDTLRKPGANPTDFAGAVGKALAEAKSRIDRMQFADAQKILDEELARSNDMAKGRAALLAERGRVARLQLHYKEAASFYQAASGTVASFDIHAAWYYATNAAGALYTKGDEFGDNAALSEAIQRFQDALALVPRDKSPSDWAATQVWLGKTLRKLGERESGTDRLEQAVAACRAALEILTRNRVPMEWATTQVVLGNALLRLGERESGTARLEQAVVTFRAALEERTRDRVPLDWAMTQNNLGNALWRLGERESGTERLEQGVAAYRAALEEYTHDRMPLDWAMMQNNLGNALRTLGARESGTARLEQAVAAYHAALEERTRDRLPLDWAMTQNNLGLALRTLGARESGTARLEQAVVAYRAALEERTRDRVPLDWAQTQNNLGNALRTLGARESGTARLEQAVVAYRAALEERTRDRVPLDWAMTQNNLGLALHTLGARETGIDRLEQAVAAYRAALEERTRDRVPLGWADSQYNLGNTLATLAERTQDRARMTDALAAMRNAAEVYRQGNVTSWLPIAERRVKDMEAVLAKMQ